MGEAWPFPWARLPRDSCARESAKVSMSVSTMIGRDCFVGRCMRNWNRGAASGRGCLLGVMGRVEILVSI